MKNKTKFCLLVEDDPEDQAFFLDALHSVSIDVACYAVSNGEEALSALSQQEVEPDYIFTDLNMPGMDGFELLKTLKKNSALEHIPVIVYSSAYSAGSIREVRDLGASAFYPKRGFGVLKDILKNYFSETHYSPTIL